MTDKTKGVDLTKLVGNPDITVLETEAMKAFVPAPILRPAFYTGGLEDVPTSRIVPGLRGNTVMLGGFAHVNSRCGGGNTFKSEQLIFPFCSVLGRYRSARGIFYDTENTMTYERLERGMHKYPATEYYDAFEDTLRPDDERKLTFVQAAEMSGEEYIRHTRNLSRERTKNKRSARPKGMVSLPILDQHGKLMKMMAPMLSICDSLSMFSVTSIMDKTVESNDIGHKDNNMIFMKDGAAKTQMFIQLPGITTNGDVFIGFVAHVGNHIAMDPYAPKPGALTFQRNGTKLKGVPEKFSFINNYVTETYSLSKLINPKDKTPFYPRDAADKTSGNDLMQINNLSTRNKSGPTGVESNYVVSQKGGIDPDMSRFHTIKAFGKPGYGMDGNDQHYFMLMLPDIKLSRTTVWNKVSDNPLLKRAIGVCLEMLQMNLFWGMEDKYRMSPEELTNAIIKRGYKWEDILNTREHWVFVEDEPYEELPELSTWDIIRMAVDEYHPFFIKEIPAKHPKKEFLEAERKKYKKEIDAFAKACPHLMR